MIRNHVINAHSRHHYNQIPTFKSLLIEDTKDGIRTTVINEPKKKQQKEPTTQNLITSSIDEFKTQLNESNRTNKDQPELNSNQIETILEIARNLFTEFAKQLQKPENNA